LTRAVLSLGTNTVRLLVVRDGASGMLEEVEHAQTGTRLGEGLQEGGMLAPQAVARTLAAASDFAERARRHGALLASIATSAVRRAADSAALSERLQALTGVPLEILSGETEATYSFAGATAGAPQDGARIAVIDVGGGSTECAVGRDGRLEGARSREIGSVRLSEHFPALLGGEPGPPAHAAAAQARAAARQILAAFAAFAPVDEVRAVAGSPATIAAVATRSDVERVAGLTLTVEVLDATLERLLDLDVAARRALPGMLPQRADVIAGGAIVLSEALRVLGAGAARIERNDLLLGFLLARVPGAPGVCDAESEVKNHGMMVESVDTADF